MIEEPFQGSEDEIKLLIANFQRDQDKKKRELQDVKVFGFSFVFRYHVNSKII